MRSALHDEVVHHYLHVWQSVKEGARSRGEQVIEVTNSGELVISRQRVAPLGLGQ